MPLSPRARVASTLDKLRSSLWPLPMALIAVAGVLAFGTLELDARNVVGGSSWWIFHAGPDGARSTLSAIATSIVTLAGISISMTAVVLQLASNQFSPRVVRIFLRDLLIQLVVGTYVGSFTYTLLVLRAIRSAASDGHDFVAPVSVALAVILAVLCVILLVLFVHHIARSLQASSIVDLIADETKDAIAHLYPESIGDPVNDDREEATPDERPLEVHARTEGYLSYVDASGFRLRQGVVEIAARVGDFVRSGDVVARVWSQRCSEGDVGDALVFEDERTMQQDVRFGFHLLSDVALRALSPGINDPTTAVYAVNKIGDLLCRLVVRRFADAVRAHPNVRVVARRPSFDEILRVAVEPVVVFGAADARVLHAVLDALDAVEARATGVRVTSAHELRAAVAAAARGADRWTSRQRAEIAARAQP